jgi:regulator of RNase E activity RraA
VANGGGRVGSFVPDRVGHVDAAAPDSALAAQLRVVSGLSAAASDALDTLGLRLSVAASVIGPLGSPGSVVGRAITLRYMPARTVAPGPEPLGRLAHRTLFDLAEPGDVVVVSAAPRIDASVMGGEALAAGRVAGIAAVVVDGAVRDIDELLAVGLPVWAARHTTVTGRGRLEAVEINGPVDVSGVQVLPGDVVIADASGVSFVPAELFAEVARRILGRP